MVFSGLYWLLAAGGKLPGWVKTPDGSSSCNFKFSWQKVFRLGCGKAELYTVKLTLTACTGFSLSLFLVLRSPALGLLRQPVYYILLSWIVSRVELGILELLVGYSSCVSFQLVETIQCPF